MSVTRFPSKVSDLLRVAWFPAVCIATVAIFLLKGRTLFADLHDPAGFALIFTWLFAVILMACLHVVRHADGLAEIVGEPYGTLILTLAVTAIEVVSISAVMLEGASNHPTLVRDTLFSVVMVILGGMAGASLLVGGWRHREQTHNLQGANAYLGVIIPLAVMVLTLPNFTVSTAGPTLSGPQQLFDTLICVGLYATFLAIQTGRHRDYFAAGGHGQHAGATTGRSPWMRHTALLLAYMIPVAFLAEDLAHPIDYMIETLRMPDALGGVVIALIVATPESVTALRAALANKLQLAVNIFLGSVLCTIGLTVPVMLAISQFTGNTIYVGLSGANDVLLLLTLIVSVVTFSSGRTNILQGAVHVVLFGAFLLLIFQG
jgi:Ca2+:H+ antiporter